MLFTDAAILTETPPLRACGSLVGQQAEVPITGNRDEKVVSGALNPATGRVWLDEAAGWNRGAFQGHLRNVRACWRGWHVVLLLDRGSPHTAKASRAWRRTSGWSWGSSRPPARSCARWRGGGGT